MMLSPIRQLIPLLLAVAVVGGTPCLARAGFTVSSQTVTATPGTIGSVQVLLTNNFGTSQTLSGFSLDIALGGSGVRFTGVDDQTSPAYLFNGAGTGTLTFDPFPNSGFIASDISLSLSGFVTLAPGQTAGLARIAFEVDSTAVAGLRPITFTPGFTTQFLDGAGTPYADADISLGSGGIDVQRSEIVVPEPSSAVLCLVGTGCGLLAAWRKRRRRMAAFSLPPAPPE
jgi:hypothetical protein